MYLVTKHWVGIRQQVQLYSAKSQKYFMLKGPKGRELEILEFHTPQESLRSPLIYKLWAHQNSLDTTEFLESNTGADFLNFTETFFYNWSKFKPCPQKLQSAVPRPRPNPDHSCTRSTVRSCSNSLLTAALIEIKKLCQKSPINQLN